MMRFLLLVCLLAPFASHAEIYKWTDVAGQVHYGNKSLGRSAQEIIIQKHEEAPAIDRISEQQRLNKIKKWVDVRQTERDLEKQRKSEEKRKIAQRKKKCKSLKNQLKKRERGGSIWYTTDDHGGRQYFSEEDLDENTSQLRAQIKQDCS